MSQRWKRMLGPLHAKFEFQILIKILDMGLHSKYGSIYMQKPQTFFLFPSPHSDILFTILRSDIKLSLPIAKDPSNKALIEWRSLATEAFTFTFKQTGLDIAHCLLTFVR